VPAADRAAAALSAARIGTCTWDAATGSAEADAVLLELVGQDPATFDGATTALLAHVDPQDRARIADVVAQAAAADGRFRVELRLTLPGHRTRWLATAGSVEVDGDGSVARVVAAAHELSDDAHRRSEALRVLDEMPAAFYSLDPRWRFTYVNAEAERVVARPRDELLGRSVWDAFPAAIGSDFERHYRLARDTGHPVVFDAYYPAPLDAWYQIRVWPGSYGLAVYFLDVTDQLRAQAALAREATHDALTDLPNRSVFFEVLAHALGSLARHPAHVGVLFVDLDGLKKVNDALGHRAGDELLVECAARIAAALRPHDILARLGGDEFVVLLEDLVDPGDADHVADRITAALAEPYVLRGREVGTSASVGVATSNSSTATADALVSWADAAMYRAKQAGGGRSSR
jgi:diguanylate cyclase (GGDEF)-like protein